MVHPEKSAFVPSQEIEYLGFIINSVIIPARLTTGKKRKILGFCHDVLLIESVSLRLVFKLLGKLLVAFMP